MSRGVTHTHTHWATHSHVPGPGPGQIFAAKFSLFCFYFHFLRAADNAYEIIYLPSCRQAASHNIYFGPVAVSCSQFPVTQLPSLGPRPTHQSPAPKQNPKQCKNGEEQGSAEESLPRVLFFFFISNGCELEWLSCKWVSGLWAGWMDGVSSLALSFAKDSRPNDSDSVLPEIVSKGYFWFKKKWP